MNFGVLALIVLAGLAGPLLAAVTSGSATCATRQQEVRRMADHAHSPFGTDRFGRAAERFARFFGTPKFILGQTLLVAVWIALNAIAVSLRWDPYPFILLNLAFSTQAADAAPLILLAQTRQADRDKAAADHIAQIADAQRRHVEQQSGGLRDLVEANTALTQRIAAMTSEIHATACGQAMPQLSDDATPPPPNPPAGAA